MLDLEMTQETAVCPGCPPAGVYRVVYDAGEMRFAFVGAASVRYEPVLIRMTVRQWG